MANEHSPEIRETKNGRLAFLDTRIDVEILLYLVLIALAIVSRFTSLGERVMSHDETTHVYFSWLLSEGKGYQHDPLSHGPFQFHFIALSYFLFGDTDASARFPAALFGVIAVGILWVFRRWLGRAGALTAAGLILISPYMLYYSRYARNEALTVPLYLLTLWGIFRYLETKQARWLYMLALVGSLHFATKETAFIFTAQILLFLVVTFAWRAIRKPWPNNALRWTFILGLVLTAIGTGMGLRGYFQARTYDVAIIPDDSEPLEGVDPTLAEAVGPSLGILSAGIIAATGLALILLSLILAYRSRLRTDFPSLDLLVIFWTMVLPQLGAIPATIFGWDPLNYTDQTVWTRTLVAVVTLLAVSTFIGLVWNWKKWLIAAGIFAVPYIVLYSTIFTNGKGLASGLVGSLGYWLVQQGVERGSQPPFYYALIQIPIYEFLPALAGTFAALAAGVTWLSRMRLPESDVGGENESGVRSLLLVFLGYWAISTLLAYSFAGERMPWITVHITLPFILLAGWGVGAFLERLEWRKLRENRGWLVAGLLILLTISILRAITSLLGEIPPFQGYEIPQLNASVNFLAAVAVALGTSIALVRSAQGWSWTHVARLFGVIALVILTLVTIRTSARAAYVNYDEATEFLVYAHMARGPKTILEQVDDLSERLSNNPDFKIAYDNESTYPFWWYLRDNEKAIYFGANPSRDLLNYSVLIVGDANWSKLDPLVQDAFHTYDYMRIWWPNQDYFQWSRSSLESDRNNELRAEGVTEIPPMGVGEHLLRFWQKISPYILDPAHRNAAWEIWFNRDFTEYGELKGVDFSLTNWSPSSKMRLYVRKDVASRVWDYGVDQPEVEYADIVDPYEDELILLYPDQSIGGSGVETGSFVSPRGNAIAPDGSLYVADTMSHRIQHFDPDGEVLHVWGRFGSTDQGNADEGAFNEPWGIGVAPDGSVYVADTWNHRIQHFTADGEFLGMFGTFGQGETPYAFWGPRDVVVDSTGRVFVSDTGNKRVVIFDQQGEYLSEFGGFGLDMGFLDEPVGLALDELGRLYVADTWNQRIQVFEEAGNSVFRPIAEWPITAWFGQSLDNKPYLSVGRGSVVCTTDPEGPRVLCFDQEGEFLVGWGSSVDEGLFFGNLSGISFDDDCGVWVTDTGNGQIMHFSLDICQE